MGSREHGPCVNQLGEQAQGRNVVGQDNERVEKGKLVRGAASSFALPQCRVTAVRTHETRKLTKRIRPSFCRVVNLEVGADEQRNSRASSIKFYSHHLSGEIEE